MKKLTTKKQHEINGGHYHWYCSLNGFLSTGYYSKSTCKAKMDEHNKRYAHTTYTSIQTCNSSHCSVI